jgi:pimeloyl-ACP methyl ester carboxylesterase
MRKLLLSGPIALAALFVVSSVAIIAQTPTPTPASTVSVKGKTPVIIIPGFTGSELVNSKTGEEVWFKPRRSHDDDLQLPISANLARNRDNLVPGDIIRSVKLFKFLPESEIYERLINTLEARGGYKEGSFKNPPRDGFQDTFYVFPYDWRRDNVENARLLVRELDRLRRSLGKPNLKFNVVAHSMGGMIARYAAMYGNADLPRGNPVPTWAGAKYFDKIFLLGTPNEGSVQTLDVLLNGFSYIGGGINLPFIQNISRFDVFTIPAIYQLLPHNGSFRLYGEDLKPISADLYDPATWDKYDWSIWKDKDFTKKFTPLEQKNARPYFVAVLARAKRFEAALDAPSIAKPPVSFYLMGADCKETQNAAVVVFDKKKNEWRTIFKAESFTRDDGQKVADTELKAILFAMGDGVVTKESLSGGNSAETGPRVELSPVSELFQCEVHNKLVTNPEIQDKLLVLLAGAPSGSHLP